VMLVPILFKLNYVVIRGSSMVTITTELN
jgi:hypothetical protein